MIKTPVTKCDMGTQTDTHLVESNIVKSYEWNEWELRRKAIKLVGVNYILSMMLTKIVYNASVMYIIMMIVYHP